ncbi:MAG: cytoplasmic protein [Oscillospiraceae bacterium]|nr:cytoplasmic protein [Oscillospiraceae bacterium]
MFTDVYQKMHRARSMNNRGALLDSGRCGCFFCLKLFDPVKITGWLREETAVCPYCSVDAVIPESYEYDLDDSLLLAMKEYWF